MKKQKTDIIQHLIFLSEEVYKKTLAKKSQSLNKSVQTVVIFAS